jgi:flagellar hook assembly protein FlgD
VDGVRNAGDQRGFWDGKDDRGSFVGSGVYVYQLESGNKSLTRKMSLLK